MIPELPDRRDGDAATWLPPAKSYRCEYVSRQIAIKHKYELWEVKAEKAAMARDAGAAPVRRGDAGYAWHLDRDGDGVGCE